MHQETAFQHSSREYYLQRLSYNPSQAGNIFGSNAKEFNPVNHWGMNDMSLDANPFEV